MPEIEVSIAGRRYRVACDPGQEEHLEAAARTLAQEADSLQGGGSGMLTESRLLLLAALIVADKLNSADAKLRAAAELPPSASSADAPAADDGQRIEAAEALAEDALALLDSTAVRLEALADQVAPVNGAG